MLPSATESRHRKLVQKLGLENSLESARFLPAELRAARVGTTGEHSSESLSWGQTQPGSRSLHLEHGPCHSDLSCVFGAELPPPPNGSWA